MEAPQPPEPPREGTCEGAQELFPDTNPGPGSLKAIPVPEPTNLGTYVRNRTAAIALGKALFWDMQVGSDGIQACASCHFRAGADPRSINQLNPGGQDNPDTTVDMGLNRQLLSADFPLHKVSDPTNRQSTVLRSVDDVVSSAGVHLRQFVRAEPRREQATTRCRWPIRCSASTASTCAGRSRATRRRCSTPRSHHLNFWDRRARNIFNGVSVQGAGDQNARVLRAPSLDADRRPRSCASTTPAWRRRRSARRSAIVKWDRWAGRSTTSASASRPPSRCGNQKVSTNDSVLGPYVNAYNPYGLNTTYKQLIETAFEPVWWRSNLIVVENSNGSLSFVPKPNRPLHDNEYTMMEYNFALYFGLSVQLYEMTLISDDAPIDRYFEGQTSALTAKEIRGMEVFTGESACAGCHSGAETTDNSRRILFGAIVDGVQQPAELVERMFNGECEVVAYDQGNYNLGVRPTEEDLGTGGNDPFGNPLTLIKLLTLPSNQIPAQELLTFPIPNIANPPIQIGERTITDGTFKVPNLRNLELTAPYFHNGGQRTIRQVVEFYNRGGDFREHNVLNIDFEIGKLNLTPDEIDDLVAFLSRPLTDPRVAQQKAPFDHPQLFVPNGHRMNGASPVVGPDGVAKDNFLEIPAVGRFGGPLPAGFLQP